MDKEKILQQLENKLLPSVKNLEKEQSTEYDFLPALLWMLLEKSKDSEVILKDVFAKQNGSLREAVNFLNKNQQSSILKIEQIINEKIDTATTTIIDSDKNSQQKINIMFEESQLKIEKIINEKTDKTTSIIVDSKKDLQQILNSMLEKQQKTANKLSLWLGLISIVQIICLILLAISLLK